MMEETVGAADIVSRAASAAASTVSNGARSGGGKVGVVELGLFSVSATTRTLDATALGRMRPMRIGGVGVPDVATAPSFARTSTPSAPLGLAAIGEGGVDASDSFLATTYAEAPTPWTFQGNPMARRETRAPCVADFVLSTIFMQAAHDDPMETMEVDEGRSGVVERGARGARWRGR